MEDLTIIYLTTNRVPEEWAKFQREKLLEAVGDTKIISLSREPMDFGENILQTGDVRTENIFYQLLRGAKQAKTDFIAVAEDDTLYPKEHFEVRAEAFCYNSNRWCLYTWGEPVYHLKTWIRTNAVMVGPREMAIESLEERFAKHPIDSKNFPLAVSKELGHAEKRLGITPRRNVDYKSSTPVVQFDHDYWTSGVVRSNNFERELERHRKKNYGDIKAYDIPVWGKASELVKKFK